MSIYCTYLTFYSGNKLPPFYIGHTTISKIENESYHGSVSSKQYRKYWNDEKKNHPELFKTQILTTHNSKKEAFEKETFFQKKMNVLNNPLYINKAIGQYCDNRGRKRSEEYIKGLRKRNIGKKLSQETKEKISKANKGQLKTTKGIQKSAAHRRKISEGLKGRKQSLEHIEKRRQSLLKKNLTLMWY